MDITMEDKIKWLEEMKKRHIFLNDTCKSCLPDDELVRLNTIIDEIIKDVKKSE